MARTKGSYSLSANIEVSAGAPIDARDRVQSMDDLTAAGTFPYHYVGMETYVVSANKKYRLIGNNPTVLANWEEVGSGGSGTGGHTIEDPTGTDMTARSNLQFTGGSVSVSDDETNDRTVVEMPDLMPASDMENIVYPLPDPRPAPKLDELSNVTISNVTNGQVLKYNSTASKWENANESGGGGGHTIEDPTGTSMTARSNLQFTGAANVSDDSTNDRTIVDVPKMASSELDDIITPLPSPSSIDIEDLGDVNLSNLSNGQILKYDARNSEWINANESGGGGGGQVTGLIDRLVYGEDNSLSGSTDPRALELTEGSRFSEYLSYSDSTNLFTVIKPFTAKIVSWVRNGKSSTYAPVGVLLINGTVTSSFTAKGNYQYAIGGDINCMQLKEGDTIGVTTNSSSGWPQLRIKIYYTEGSLEEDILIDQFDNVGIGYSIH